LGDSDDRGGGVFMGLLISFGSIVLLLLPRCLSGFYRVRWI
jgi:hypothetical protein